MGLFNTFDDDVICPGCKTTNHVSCQFKNYGILDQVVKVGSRFAWKGPGVPGSARERILRYVDIGGADCKNCHADIANVLIVRNDIIDETYSFPQFAGASGQRLIDLRPNFKDWEIRLLELQHGAEKVTRTYFELLDRSSKSDWRAHVQEGRDRIMAIQEQIVRGKANPAGWHEFFDWAKENDPFPVREQLRDALINMLMQRGDAKSSAPCNFLDYEFECPNCGKDSGEKIPFLYGPCDGSTYQVQKPIQWTRQGHIPQLRDPELRYVEVFTPLCDCGHMAAGIVTVRKDVITDVFIWSNKLRNLSSAKDDAARLDEFLMVREFGAEVYLGALEKRNEVLGRRNTSELYTLAASGDNSAKTDYEVVFGFYAFLQQEYKRRNGREYE